MTRPLGLLGLLALLLAPASTAVVVDTSAPELYEVAPSDDPGWRNVGRRGNTTAIYLGDGWVLTARHSSMGGVEFDGTAYDPVPGTFSWLESPLGGIKADLLMFRVSPEPALPALPLRRRPMAPGDRVTFVGYGQGRGRPAQSGPGYVFDGRPAKRWGENEVEPDRLNLRGPNDTLTLCFATRFDRSVESGHEAQATVGDSGGAVFHQEDRQWRLAGVMLSVSSSRSQRKDEALFGNTTHSADLGAYASQILAIMGRARDAHR